MKSLIKYIILTYLAFISFEVFTQIPTNGLVASYPFNGDGNDESGKGNDGSLYGVTLTLDRCEIENKAYYFDGVNDYIDIGRMTMLNSSLNNFSISLWIKTDTINKTHYETITKTINNAGYGTVFSIEVNRGFSKVFNPGVIRLDLRDESEKYFTIYTDQSQVFDDEWHHIVFVVVDAYNNIGRVYIDNNRIEDPIYTMEAPNSFEPFEHNLVLGAANNRGNIETYFKGALDDIRIYDRSLTDEEIERLYYYNCYEVELIGDTSVCKGEIDKVYYIISNTEISDYDWSYTGTGVTIVGTRDTISINFSNSATSGLLKVIVSGDSLASTSIELPITVNSTPKTTKIIGDSIICPNKAGYNYFIPTVENAEEYIWNYTGTGVDFNANNIPSILIDFTQDATSGMLTVAGINECGIGEVVSLFINVDTTIPTIGEIIGENNLCKNYRNIFRIESNENIQHYNWQYTNSDIEISSSYDSAVIYFLESGPGVLTVTGENKCGVVASSPPFSIYVDPCELNIPNSFTPNNDGINDIFYIRNLPENTRLMIFNRIGKELYITNNYQNNWDGKDNNGKILETGTYWYIIIVPKIKDPFSGFVYLKR